MKKPLASSFLTRAVLLALPLLLVAFTTGDTKSEYTLQPAAYSIFTGDFDLDGDTDIVTGHKFNVENNWGGGVFLDNDGYGYFQVENSYFVNNGFPGVHGDYLDDNDYLDIYSDHVTADPYNVYVGIIYNYGYSQFDSLKSFSIDTEIPTQIFQSGDIDGDVFSDIVFASNQGQFWGVLYNDGTGNFSEPEYHYVYGYYPTGLDCGDLNGDNREDIVIAGADVEIYYSLESGFQQFQLSEQELRVKIIDFDNDGDNDIIGLSDLYMVGYFSISIYENLQGGNFFEHEEYYFQPSGSELVVEDFNNDSLPDLLVALNNTTGHHLLYNLGDNSLSDPVFISVDDYGEYSRKIHSDDLDGNGYNDIVTVRYLYSPLSNNLSILFNDGNGTFQEDPITGQDIPKVKGQIPMVCYPNPFTQITSIEIKTNENEYTDLSVYNLSGKKVKTLTNYLQEGGINKIKWDGLDFGGKPCKPGPYLLTLRVNGNVLQTIKLMKY